MGKKVTVWEKNGNVAEGRAERGEGTAREGKLGEKKQEKGVLKSGMRRGRKVGV